MRSKVVTGETNCVLQEKKNSTGEDSVLQESPEICEKPHFEQIYPRFEEVHLR